MSLRSYVSRFGCECDDADQLGSRRTCSPVSVVCTHCGWSSTYAPLERLAQRDRVGVWRIPELVLAVPGKWEIELDVLISDFERQTLKGSLELDKR